MRPSSQISPSAAKTEKCVGLEEQRQLDRPKSILQALYDEAEDPFLLCGTYKAFADEMEKHEKQKLKAEVRSQQIDMRYFKHLRQVNHLYTETRNIELQTENAIKALKVRQSLQQNRYARKSISGQFIEKMTVKQDQKPGAVNLKKYFNIFNAGEVSDANISSMREIFTRQFD